MKPDTCVSSAVNPGLSCAEQLSALVQKFKLLGPKAPSKVPCCSKAALGWALCALTMLMTDWSSVFHKTFPNLGRKQGNR